MSEDLQNYNFPRYSSEPLVKRAPRLDQEGIDLVSQFLLYEAKRRLGAKEALHHAYFAALGPQVHTIADGEAAQVLLSGVHFWKTNLKFERESEKEGEGKRTSLPINIHSSVHDMGLLIHNIRAPIVPSRVKFRSLFKLICI